jgi:hypothetical protein
MLQWGALRCRAVDWARRVRSPNHSYLPVPALENRVDEDKYAAFCTEMSAALAGIIAAEAARASGPDVPELYSRYLEVLGPLMNQVQTEGFQTAIQSALDQLASKSPELQDRILRYHAATDELLRWRERIASEAVAVQVASTASGREIIEQGLRSRDSYQGLFSDNMTKLATARLSASCPEILAGGAGNVVGQPVHVGRCTTLPVGTLGVTIYSDRMYATFPRPDVGAEVQKLKQELLADQSAPLSLRAAVAVASADAGDFTATGGTVQSVFLEGLIPRFATLPEAALPMISLGPIKTEEVEATLIYHVLVRLQIAPTWISHRYFFVELPTGPTPATAG